MILSFLKSCSREPLKEEKLGSGFFFVFLVTKLGQADGIDTYFIESKSSFDFEIVKGKLVRF
jgi:hypothetical protein